jgi:GntR family transcriptional regulator/MocR family aminotransferase
MPSPRLIASEFGCSRHTVSTSYDFLIAEGILVSRHGVGTFVSEVPSLLLEAPQSGDVEDGRSHALALSRFATSLEDGGIGRDEEDPLQTFGIPDVDTFPWTQWAKIYSGIWSQPRPPQLRTFSAQGDLRLREAICQLAHRTRGIKATPDQVLITTGTTQSLDLLLRALLNPGASVWIEDPGRPKAAALIHALGMTAIPVPVDDAGIQVETAQEAFRGAGAALVTASHHYPTGATLSLERRIALLSWANQTGGWVFEDDYDGEIIADGRPMLPIYSLGCSDRVIYMGTFSKSISPQLRLGYLICRSDLVQALVKLRYYIDYFPPVSLQPVLAQFIEAGHLEAHIRRMRRIYRERQTIFSAEVARHGSNEFALTPTAPALFQTLKFRDLSADVDDRLLAQQARISAIPAYALSAFFFRASSQPGVIVGTGRLRVPAISEKVKQLVIAYRQLQATSTG